MLLLFITTRLLPERGFVHIRSNCDFAALILAIITVACMVASDELYRAWSPFMGDLAFAGGVSRSVTFLVLFTTDLMVAFWLITRTGGSKRSPFTTLLFTIPSLAIFLREPPSRFLTYLAVAAMFYLLGLLASRNRLDGIDVLRGGDDPPGMPYAMKLADTPAHVTVNLGCLFIAAVTGYITRPVPI